MTANTTVPDSFRPFEEVVEDATTRSGRYQISATVNGATVFEYGDDLELLQATMASALERPFADDREAFGAIYDRRTCRTVRTWRGGAQPSRGNPMLDLYGRAIASGQKVFIAVGSRCAEFGSVAA